MTKDTSREAADRGQRARMSVGVDLDEYQRLQRIEAAAREHIASLDETGPHGAELTKDYVAREWDRIDLRRDRAEAVLRAALEDRAALATDRAET